MSRPSEKEYWSLAPESVAGLLNTDSRAGLSAQEAANRLSRYGRNVLEVRHGSDALKIFFNQLKSPLILILIIAGAVMLFLAHYRDASFIFVAVAVNAALGFWQESKAERALAGLKTYLKQRVRVVRDGKEREMDAEEIVPGDIIRLAQGDRVPADGRIMSVSDFQVDESILTGESLPVGKTVEAAPPSASVADQSSMLFAGTLVTQGVATVIVCRIAASTELGKIASLIASSEGEKTPLQKAIATFSVYLSTLLVVLTATVFVLGIVSGKPVLEMFLTSVAIAVSAIPEGLPISLTVILAIGVERMARRKGVVRKLVAAEALGSTSLVLTDKTGTLTMAKMTMSRIISFGLPDETLLLRALSNTDVLLENPDEAHELWRMSGRFMEVALVRAAAGRGFSSTQIFDRAHVEQVMPFSSVQKYSATLVSESGKHTAVLLGAPDILLARSSLSRERKQEVMAHIDTLASAGERVLGLASRPVRRTKGFSLLKDFLPERLSFDALLTFKDPVRPGVKSAIERIQRAGVRTVILTGDHRGTALAVARELGLPSDASAVLDASELITLSDEALQIRLRSVAVISRVTPADKLRVAKLFQQMGEVVAMTGDGVNDAPSIKQADVGIAMGSGTEVSRSVADLVLLNDNFETIVAAIEEGRQILKNIRKVLVYLLSNVADGLILIGGAIITGVPLPLNALQILWVNFFSDSFPAVAFAFERDTDGLSRRPRGKLVLFDPLMRFLILGIGISTSAFLFGIYLVLLRLGYDTSLVQTFIFASFGTYTLIMALSVRSLEKSLLSHPLFSNLYLTGGIVIGIALMVAAVYLPPLQVLFGTVSLPLLWVLGVLLVGIINIVLIELAKLFFRKQIQGPGTSIHGQERPAPRLAV